MPVDVIIVVSCLQLMEEGGSSEEDLSEIESDLDEVTEEDQILSFRKSELDDDDDDDDVEEVCVCVCVSKVA